MCHLAESVQSSGFDISDALDPSPLFNDNAACIQWSHNMTSKKIRHMELRENSVREWVENKTRMSSMSVDVLIPLTFSPKRCGMEHTFDGCKILSCVASPTFFSSHFWSSIISQSQPHTQLIVRWYLQPRLQMRFLHKTHISKLCVPFPYVEPSQLFPTCRALAISSYDAFIKLFHQD